MTRSGTGWTAPPPVLVGTTHAVAASATASISTGLAPGFPVAWPVQVDTSEAHPVHVPFRRRVMRTCSNHQRCAHSSTDVSHLDAARSARDARHSRKPSSNDPGSDGRWSREGPVTRRRTAAPVIAMCGTRCLRLHPGAPVLRLRTDTWRRVQAPSASASWISAHRSSVAVAGKFQFESLRGQSAALPADVTRTSKAAQVTALAIRLFGRTRHAPTDSRVATRSPSGQRCRECTASARTRPSAATTLASRAP